uniref:Uncharacterized protein n=1 Tax=viral metagenome TaxID=1070528 RepID=A0A6C0JNY1_9ZZZZ
MSEQQLVHPEWEKENSLTAPSDRDPTRTYQPNQGHPPLSEEDVVNAVSYLNNNTFVKKFLRVERRYADPVDPMQRIGLISFVPAKGATPNEKGVYGFAKLRGNYPTDAEAGERAEFLIRNADSYHQIYHAYVGRPFPCTISSDYSEETSEIDLRKTMTESVSTSIKQKKNDERREIKEIEDREKQLFAEAKQEEEDPLDFYTTLRVKKAQVTWTYLETQKKLDEMKATIIKTREQIEKMEGESEEYAKNYFKKYCDARSESGLDNSANQDTFMKFLVEDVKLDF